MSTRQSQSDQVVMPRNNQELAVIHNRASALPRRFHNGKATPNDFALAAIMASALEKRKN